MLAQIESICLTVNTTNDDKDDELWWVVEVFADGALQATAVLGKSPPPQTWPNDDTRDFLIKVKTPFQYSYRLHYSLRITQHSSGKNRGWEGNIEAVGHHTDGMISPLLRNTGNFKLGENNNPLTRDLPFNL